MTRIPRMAAAALLFVSVAAVSGWAAAADTPATDNGLRSLVAEYQTRVANRYTAGSWAPFAQALHTAAGVAADRSAAAPQVAAAKTALMTAAANLAAADDGTFQ